MYYTTFRTAKCTTCSWSDTFAVDIRTPRYQVLKSLDNIFLYEDFEPVFLVEHDCWPGQKTYIGHAIHARHTTLPHALQPYFLLPVRGDIVSSQEAWSQYFIEVGRRAQLELELFG